MGFLFFANRRRNRRVHDALPLPRQELARLRRWLEASAALPLASATPDVFDTLRITPPERRDTHRIPIETIARLRPISAGGIGLVSQAPVRDVSAEGVALLVDAPLPVGQRLSLEIDPPAGLPRKLQRRGDGPVQLLAKVRYCRPEGEGFVIGCSIGVDWADSLAHQMFPADLPARRSA